MSRTCRDWNQDQSWRTSPSPLNGLPDGHLSYLPLDVLVPLDLSPIMEKHHSEKHDGKKGVLLVLLLFYSYCIGEFSSRLREQFQHVFVEVLRLCRESGLLKVGRLALDVTKIKVLKT